MRCRSTLRINSQAIGELDIREAIEKVTAGEDMSGLLGHGIATPRASRARAMVNSSDCLFASLDVDPVHIIIKTAHNR
jgi:hypothetical protein